MTVHPARLVLADHQPRYVTATTQAAQTVRCDCRDWAGPWCEFPEHQTRVLAEAGWLACPSCGHATSEHYGEGCSYGWGAIGMAGCSCPGDMDAAPEATP